MQLHIPHPCLVHFSKSRQYAIITASREAPVEREILIKLKNAVFERQEWIKETSWQPLSPEHQPPTG